MGRQSKLTLWERLNFAPQTLPDHYRCRNRWGQKCARCQQWVNPNDGVLAGWKENGSAKAVHLACPTRFNSYVERWLPHYFDLCAKLYRSLPRGLKPHGKGLIERKWQHNLRHADMIARLSSAREETASHR